MPLRFGKYLLENSTGLFAASAAPSIHSVYERDMNVSSNTLCVFISQSGASPDLLAAAEAARQGVAHLWSRL